MVVKDNNIISDNYALVNPKHADTADKLAVQRKLWGLNFDGTTDIDGNIVIKKKAPDVDNPAGITINASDNTNRAKIEFVGNTLISDGASLNISSYKNINLLPGIGGGSDAKACVNGNKIATEVDLNNIEVGARNYFGFNKGIFLANDLVASQLTAEFLKEINGILLHSTSTITEQRYVRMAKLNMYEPGDYTISFYAKSDSAVSLKIDICDITIQRDFQITTSYTKFIGVAKNVYDYLSGHPDGYAGFVDFNVFNSPANNNIYIKNLKIEKGNKATDWSPAFEDLAYANLDLTGTLAYGIEWDTTIADPHCTRIGNSLLHKQLPIQSAYRGCVVKNGVLQYYLNPNDWAYKEDGTPSVLDGTDGDVMVHTPKFYGKSEIDGNKRRVWISTMKIDSTWTEVPELYVSAYRNTIHNVNDNGTVKTLAASVVNTTAEYRGGNGADQGNDSLLSTEPSKTNLGKPRTNISRATMRQYAINAGQELLSYELYKWIFYWAYVIEYANFDSQETFNSNLTSDGYHQGGLGAGVTHSLDWSGWANYNGNQPMTPCGYCNNLGNFTGIKTLSLSSVSITYDVPRWRGFDNPFGDIWTNLDGIVIDTPAAGATDTSVQPTAYIVYTSDKYTDSLDTIKANFDKKVTFCHSAGWINEFVLGSNAEIIPETSGGTANANTDKCDYFWIDYDLTQNTLSVGGAVGGGSLSGLGAFYAYHGVGRAYSDVGFRSVIRI